MWVYDGLCGFIPNFWGTMCFSFWGGMLGDSLEVFFKSCLITWETSLFEREGRTQRYRMILLHDDDSISIVINALAIPCIGYHIGIDDYGRLKSNGSYFGRPR